MKKLGHIIIALLRALDILACVVWLAALYPFGLADRPTAYETISAYVGRAQEGRKRWAMRAAPVIDWAAAMLGDGPDHCLRSWLLWRKIRR